MEVTENVLNWLKESNVLKFPSSLEKTRFYLHELDAQAFECGLRFVPLIKRVLHAASPSERLSTPFPEINSLKDANSTAAKLYNWNTLIKVLETIEVPVDSDMKALIIAGDRAIVAEILKAILQAEVSAKPESFTTEGAKKRQKKNKLLGEGALLLDDLDLSMSLSNCESTLEFLIISFCKVFNITTKTAAGLLMQSGKYLTQILSKGLKGKIGPVLEWYDLLTQDAESLVELIEKERNSGALQVVLGSVKGGLMGKEFVVVQKCCDCLVFIEGLLAKKDINAWEWFSTEAYALSFKAYDVFKEDVTTYILKLLIAFGRDNLKDVFGQMLLQNYPEPIQCFNVISSFWGYITVDTQAYSSIQTQGLVDYWVELGLREAENESNTITPTKVSALGFLCDVWLKFAKYIEQHEDSANSILTVIKRACREKSRMLKIICYGRLFLLLSEFSKYKNSYAPIIYKTLTFALVENYSNDRVREFLLNNFLYVMEEIPGLPIGVILEPYIKQGQVAQKPRYNTSDFDFYVAAARHPKLTVKDAILVIDNLGKIYFSDYIFANSAEIPLVLIFGRFIENKPIQEYMVKFLQLGLKIIFSKLSPKPRIPARETLTKEEVEEEKVLSYYKKLVFSLTEKVIHLDNAEMNHDLKEVLIVGCLEVKAITGGVIKGMKMVLDLLGDSNTMIEKYEVHRNSISSAGQSLVNSYTPNSVVSYKPHNKRNLSIGSRTRDRALSDIEKVKQLRMQKEYHEKSQSATRKLEEERQKISLRHQLLQRKVLLGIEGRSETTQPIVVKEAITVIEMPFYSIEEENRADQEVIGILGRKYTRVFKSLFSHYASSGYKKENFHIRATFESILDKKTSITEGEFVKMLRDHGATNTFITTEEVRKLFAWVLQKQKVKSVEYDIFTQLLYYVSELIYTRHPMNFSQFPPGISLIAFLDHFKKSSSKIAPISYYDEPDYGVGDKDIAKMLTSKLKSDSNLSIPEGYRKFTDKEVEISYTVPKNMPYPKSYKVSLEILDSITSSALNFHILSPIVSIVPIVTVRGVLTKPQIEFEDKPKNRELGVPSNKAAYKAQPLPTYMSFTPGIKLEVTRLAGNYSNDLLMECARLLDDLVYTVEGKSFEVISRNPKPPGTIPNKAIQQKIMEESLAQVEKQKNDAKRLLRKQLVEENLKRMRNLKVDKEREDEENKNKEKELEELLKRKNSENREKEKNEIAKKIKEFKMKKEEEDSKKGEVERENLKKVEEKKKKEREDFLRVAKKKLIDGMTQKKEQKTKLLSENEHKLKSSQDQKKNQRKVLITKLQSHKNVISQEKNQKEQVYIAMIDSGVTSVFSAYSSGLEGVFQYFCKLMPMSNTDSSMMSLAAFNKFATSFPIVPMLSTSDEVIRVYKIITKNKSAESGINSSEFREILVNIAISSIKTLESDLGQKLETYGDLLKEFFEWINLPQDSKKASEFLKKLANTQVSVNPRDKKRSKNTLIKVISEKN